MKCRLHVNLLFYFIEQADNFRMMKITSYWKTFFKLRMMTFPESLISIELISQIIIVLVLKLEQYCLSKLDKPCLIIILSSFTSNQYVKQRINPKNKTTKQNELMYLRSSELENKEGGTAIKSNKPNISHIFTGLYFLFLI